MDGQVYVLCGGPHASAHWCTVGLQRGWVSAQWDYSGVGLVHSGTTAGLGWCTMGLQRGWTGAQWDYSGVGLVHNGTTVGLGWCTVGLQRGWAGAQWDYSGVGLVHNRTTASVWSNHTHCTTSSIRLQAHCVTHISKHSPVKQSKNIVDMHICIICVCIICMYVLYNIVVKRYT